MAIFIWDDKNDLSSLETLLSMMYRIDVLMWQPQNVKMYAIYAVLGL